MGLKLKFIVIFLCIFLLGIGFAMAFTAAVFMTSIFISVIKLAIYSVIITAVLILFTHKRKG